MNAINNFFFGLYPYVCLVVFLLGSLIRFDRDQYTWKSDSSQLLRVGQLRWGSNLFHIGVLFLFGGHLVGMLTPHFLYEPFISAGTKQVLAMTAGGIAGVLGFIGVSLLLHRRLTEPRIRATGFEGRDNAFVDRWIVQIFAGLAVHIKRNRHAPCALAGEYPVRAALNHRFQTATPAFGYKADMLADFIQRNFAEGSVDARCTPDLELRSP